MFGTPTPDAVIAPALRPGDAPAAAPALGPSASLHAPRLKPARGDALGVLIVTLLTFAVASAFQWQEHLAAVTGRFEGWQVDELPLTLVALALGLAWFAARRRVETLRLLAHNRELAQRLIEVQERERSELARELHDELAQHCTAIRVEAAWLQRSAGTGEAAASARRVADAARVLQQDVRRLLRRLRPAELDELGLAAALGSLAAAWQARSGVAIAFEAEGPVDEADADVATGVYRVAQEALANVVRHADASQAAVELRGDGRSLVLRVVDDGRGFDVTKATHGLGLVGASERAAALGGSLDVDSAPGRGTRVVLTLRRASR